MKLTQLVFAGIVLHLLNETQGQVRIAYDNHQYPNLWQKSGKFQGDMVLTPEQQARLSNNSNIQHRNGITNPFQHWRNRTIPYEISRSFSAKEKAFIHNTLKEDFGRSCVRVVPRTNERDYVFITANDGLCWSWMGRMGGRQELNLHRSGCLYYGTIVHEFLHAAGFGHQHSASNRDDYVTIKWENIITDEKFNFEILDPSFHTSFGQPYDYGSVMHYPPYAFSYNRKKTIVAPRNVEIGKATRLSDIDIKKLNAMYKC